MVYFSNKLKKDAVLSLRKQGFSYSEILKQFPIPKSTLSLWLRNLKIGQNQLDRLNKKKLGALITASRIRSSRSISEKKRIYEKSSKEITSLSKKEIWLMGILLLWNSNHDIFKHGDGTNKFSISKQLFYSSSDEYLILFFIKWLVSVGNIKSNDLLYDLLLPYILKHDNDIRVAYVNHWKNILNLKPDDIIHLYFLKTMRSSLKNKSINIMEPSSRYRINYGVFRVRVRSSSLLRYQINGWVEAIRHII